LQRVAVCCRVLQCVAVCCSVLQCVAMCCSVLQYVFLASVCVCVIVIVAVRRRRRIERILITHLERHVRVVQCVAVCYSVLQCVAVWEKTLGTHVARHVGYMLGLRCWVLGLKC